MVKLVNPLKGAINTLQKISKAGLVAIKSGEELFLKISKNASTFLAKLDTNNILTNIKWLDDGEIINYLDDVKFFDESGNIVEGSLTTVQKSNGEVGFKVVKAGSRYLGTAIDNKIKLLPLEKLFGTQASTFLNLKYVIGETLEEITTFRRFGGNAKLRGTYVSTSEKLTREELALVKSFNNSMRFEAIIKIPKGEKLAVGKVGPWPVKAPEFIGGADQIIINRFDFPENVWVETIKDFNTGKIYTYGEFRLQFPNLCVN